MARKEAMVRLMDAMHAAGVDIPNVSEWCRVNGVDRRTFCRHRARARAKVAALRRSLNENKTRSTNLIRALEVSADVDPDLVGDVSRRRAELQAERSDLEKQLTAFDDEIRSMTNPDLLNRLPITAVDLENIPDEVSRPLFEALRLEVNYNHETRNAVCRITLTGDTVETAERAATEMVAALPKQRSAGSEQIRVVPPAGYAADGNSSYQRFSEGACGC